MNRSGDAEAGIGRVMRCFIYPRSREDSNKSCPSHFITRLARADSGRAEPGVDLALSSSRPAPPQEFERPRVGARFRAKRPGRAALVRDASSQRLPAAGAHALTCVLQGQTAFLLGAPVLGTFGGVGGVGPSSWIEGNQHQSQGHELAQPLGTHGSWCKSPARRPGFFVLSSASSSSFAASPPPPTLPPGSPFPSSRPRLG